MEEHLPDREELDKKRRRFTRLSVISFFLMALLSGVSSFFVWTLGGSGVYFGFLAGYNYFLSARIDRPFQYANTNAPSPETQEYIRKHIPRVILLLVFGFAAAVIVVVTANSGQDDADNPAEEITSENSQATFDTNDPDKLLEAGNQFYNDNEFDSALLYYDKALMLRPGFKEASYNKALIYSGQQDYGAAITTLEKCISENPKYAEAIQLIAFCFYMQKQHDQALVYYQRAYDQGTRNAELSHYLGYLYDEKNNTSQALKYYKEAIGQDSTKVEVYERLAELEPDRSDFYLTKAKKWRGK